MIRKEKIIHVGINIIGCYLSLFEIVLAVVLLKRFVNFKTPTG